MTGARGLLPILCSTGLHSALAAWLVAASGAGGLQPLVIDLVVPESRPAAEPARQPAPAPARERVAPRPRAAPSPFPPAPAPATAPSPPAATGPSPAPPPVRAPAAVETAPALDAVGPAPPTASVPASLPPPADAPPRALSSSGVGGEEAAGQGSASAAPPAGPATALARTAPGARDGRGAVPAEYGGYLKRFREAVQSELRYPLSARRRGLAGSVELEVVIAPDGRVTAVKVVASSSHEMLDEAAADAVRRLRPIPLPPNLPARSLVVRLPLVFDLR